MNVVQRLKLLAADFVLWFFWFPFRRIVQFLPLRIIYIVASISAFYFYLFAGSIRKSIYKELKRHIGNLYTKKEIRKFTRKSFEMDIKRRFEELIFGKLTKDLVDNMVSIEGIEYLKQALTRGKGAIILLSHFGSFLMVLAALGFRGYRVNQIGGPPILKHHRFIHKRIFEVRKQEYNNLPITFIRSDESMLSAIKALKNNELVAIAFDGRVGKQWIPVKMFNSVAMINPGPLKIAIKTGATIIPTFIIRNNDNTHRLILEPPFELEYTKDKEKMISTNLQKLAEIFEGYIQRFPCHYGIILQIMRDRVRRGVIKYSLLPEEAISQNCKI